MMPQIKPTMNWTCETIFVDVLKFLIFCKQIMYIVYHCRLTYCKKWGSIELLKINHGRQKFNYTENRILEKMYNGTRTKTFWELWTWATRANMPNSKKKKKKKKKKKPEDKIMEYMNCGQKGSLIVNFSTWAPPIII